MATTAPVEEVPEVYGVFAGPIDQAALQRIFNNFGSAQTNGIQRVHLLLQSSGGGIGDGVCLYNFFKTSTLDLILYNAGSVASIAVIAYLGAKKRKASAHASFMLHRTQTTTQFTNTQALKVLAESAIANDRITEAILREHITMPAEKWSSLDHNDLFITAEQSIEFGIAQEIAEFAPPPGTRIYSL
jgi:ATP-dependent Clp protease, protease subunit